MNSSTLGPFPKSCLLNTAPGNNPPAGFDKLTYTYGHRNVQGIAFHPKTGTPITAEQGPWHSDEITVLVNGGNAGWNPRPNMAGRGDCPDDYCGYSPNQMDGMDRCARASFMPMNDFETYPDAMQPIWDNNGWSQGTSSAAFLAGDAWGNWNGNMVVGLMEIGFGRTALGQRKNDRERNETHHPVHGRFPLVPPNQSRIAPNQKTALGLIAKLEARQTMR